VGNAKRCPSGVGSLLSTPRHVHGPQGAMGKGCPARGYAATRLMLSVAVYASANATGVRIPSAECGRRRL
jgi:hypothetical protein